LNDGDDKLHAIGKPVSRLKRFTSQTSRVSDLRRET
jgi:hypothetical protein